VRPTTPRKTRPAAPTTARKKKCLNSALESRDWMYVIDAYAKRRKKTPATYHNKLFYFLFLNYKSNNNI
jgi:hypothetical protein